MSAGADSLKSIFFALGANFAIAVSKLAAALFTGSGAMLAEAIHSFSDCGNQLLLILGLKTAKKPPTPDHPLGYGKEIYFWSFIVALILFSMGGLFSIYEGAHKLANPEPLHFPWVAVGVLVFGIVAESLSLWGCVQEINKARGDRPMLRWLKETRSSELIVVFGEEHCCAVWSGVRLAGDCARYDHRQSDVGCDRFDRNRCAAGTGRDFCRLGNQGPTCGAGRGAFAQESD